MCATGQDGVRVECIIDPSFAEQWGIARPTPAYAHVVAALPQVCTATSHQSSKLHVDACSGCGDTVSSNRPKFAIDLVVPPLLSWPCAELPAALKCLAASNRLSVVRAQVYVGAAIEPLVDFLCSELAAAFRAEGATLPPWRAADAMLSKWRPRRSVDCDMLPPHGSFRVRDLPL